LNRCDKILEMTSKSIDLYGGNYDFYKEQKKIKDQALKKEIQAHTENLLTSKRIIQTRVERHQQNVSKGHQAKRKQISRKGSYDKLAFNAAKARSENTNRRIRLQAKQKLENLDVKLSTARAKLEIQEELNVKLANTKVPNNKTVIKIENLYFNYDKQHSLINHFNLTITGSERVAIIGPNGCGKSTLIHLIRGLLVPDSGEITIGVNMTYLDQTVSFLNANLSVVDNFLTLNPQATPFEAYSALATFKFRNTDAEKHVDHLSGGEKMRVGLAISLMASQPPQLIILDEPTNHLDLNTIESIEAALKLYKGAILAISHDEAFLRNIGITRRWMLVKKSV
jgi:ATPase subunit of ABC transporter with duplicated ATPase domains